MKIRELNVVKSVWLHITSDMDLFYTRAKQRGVILTFNNFEYNKQETDCKRTYYSCRDKKHFNFAATLATDTESGAVVRTTGEHSHYSSLLERQVKSIERDAILNASLNPTVTPRTVLRMMQFQMKLQFHRHT